MTVYEALAAAYRDNARITGDSPDAGLGNLFDEITIFAESDVEQTFATAHELEFLADVLLLAARKVMSHDGASHSRPPAPGSSPSLGDTIQEPFGAALDAYAVIFQSEETATCSHAFAGENARDHAFGYARATARTFAAEQELDAFGAAIKPDEQDNTVAINAGSSGSSWTLEHIAVHLGPHPDLVPKLQDGAPPTSES